MLTVLVLVALVVIAVAVAVIPPIVASYRRDPDHRSDPDRTGSDNLADPGRRPDRSSHGRRR